jgi:hypothetical protein
MTATMPSLVTECLVPSRHPVIRRWWGTFIKGVWNAAVTAHHDIPTASPSVPRGLARILIVALWWLACFHGLRTCDRQIGPRLAHPLDMELVPRKEKDFELVEVRPCTTPLPGYYKLVVYLPHRLTRAGKTSARARKMSKYFETHRISMVAKVPDTQFSLLHLR